MSRIASDADSAVTVEGSQWSVFEATIRDHHADLHAFAYRVLGGRGDAEDALQAAYVKAFRAVQTGLIEQAPSRPWLFRVLYRCCIDEIRRAARTQHDVLDESRLRGRREADEFVLLRALSHALLELPPPTRAAVLLVDVHGFAYDDAAAALGVPRGTIASRLNHGRAALRRALPEYAPAWRKT
jgi:RNA polymerase sigma-70 factor (ECF subfamily)